MFNRETRMNKTKKTLKESRNPFTKSRRNFIIKTYKKHNENLHAFNHSSNIITKNMIIKNFRDHLLFMSEFVSFNNVFINTRINDFTIIKLFDIGKNVK